MKILAIGPHPDDIEYGCGGTLAKFIGRGHSVQMMVMTSGEFGGSAEIRSREQLRSAEILGAEKIFWGNYSDTSVPMNKEIIDKIEKILKALEADFIFVNYFDDTHQDHRSVAAATISATRFVKNVLFYEVPTTQNFNPTIFVDIAETMKIKIDSLNAHESQLVKTNIEDLNIVDCAVASAHFRGIQGRVKYAEGFMPLRAFLPIELGEPSHQGVS